MKSELWFHADKIGRQWGRTPKEHKSQYEIDICAINEKTKEILFAECKWKEKANGISILNELKEKAKYVQWNDNKRKEYYIIFAKSFKNSMIQDKNVKLIDIKEMERFFRRK